MVQCWWQPAARCWSHSTPLSCWPGLALVLRINIWTVESGDRLLSYDHTLVHTSLPPTVVSARWRARSTSRSIATFQTNSRKDSSEDQMSPRPVNSSVVWPRDWRTMRSHSTLPTVIWQQVRIFIDHLTSSLTPHLSSHSDPLRSL